MSQSRKTSINRNRPSLIKDGFTSFDNILKLNRSQSELNSGQPTTPIVPSSSRTLFAMDKKGTKSLIGSPLPLRTMDDGYNSFGSPINMRSKINKRTDLKEESISMDYSNRPKINTTCNQMRLEKVFGFTIANNACVALDPISGVLAYPAGCVVVGYSTKRNKRFFIHNTVKSPITALAFSKDGKLLVTGESGKLPKVRIWNVKSCSQVWEFSGHNYRVGVVSFSPNGRLVVSVGSQEDMTVNVWEMNSNLKIATSRVTNKVNAIAFSENGQYFVTVGVRHVRFWYLDNSRSKTKTTVVLSGRNALLGDFMNNTFNDVGCCSLNSGCGLNQMLSSINSQSFVYVISQAGQLIQFTEQRSIERWVELQNPRATCLSVCDSLIMVGCSKGVVLIFDTVSLSHVTTIYKPHFLGIHLNSGDLDQTVKITPLRYPDVIAGKFDCLHSRITCFYSDHSLYVWDIVDIHSPIKMASHLFHSGGVWSVEPVPLNQNFDRGILDVTSFITCSDDETIRLWRLKDSHSRSIRAEREKVPASLCNDYSKELLWIIYTDPFLKCLTESDRLLVKNNHQANDSNTIPKLGVRAVKVSPDRRHLGTADREGNLRFYSLLDCRLLYSIVAHNGEILSIDYFQSPSVPDLILFCSASRDRVIHVMDPLQGYKCVQTIDDHSGAIFSAKMVETPSDQEIRLVSCGMDKSILFRILQPDETGQTAQFFLNQHLVGKHSQYDMVITPNKRYAAVACQDRQVRVYNLVTGKQRKSYRGSTAEDGNLLRCAIDPSGTYLATSGSDKSLHILNFSTGDIVASATGHSEMALGICFLYDLKHLVSVSSDNCIFVWRLPAHVTLTMQRRRQELGAEDCVDLNLGKDSAPPSTCGTVTPPRISDDMNIGSSNISICTSASGENPDIGSLSNFRFSVSALPSWAQKKFSRRDSLTFVQVNMLNDFYGGMSTVLERTEENILIEEDPKKPAVSSRRMSFVATEKVIREDDSDNVDDDDSEWSSPDKNPLCGSMDLDTISQNLSSEEEEDLADDEKVYDPTDERFQKQSNHNQENTSGSCYSNYVIQSKGTSNISNIEDLVCSSAPAPLSAERHEKYNESSHDVFDLCRDKSISSNHFSFEDPMGNHNNGVMNTNRRMSLTSMYLSTFSMGSNADTDQGNTECVANNNILDRGEQVSKAKLETAVTKRRLSSKSMSQVNVSQIGTLGRMLSLDRRTDCLHISKGNLSIPSRDSAKEDNKYSFNKSREKTTLNKSISASHASISEQWVKTRSRSSTDTFKPQSTSKSNQMTVSSDANIKSPRPKWADSKKLKIVRKTCPVDMKDIRKPPSTNNLVEDYVFESLNKVKDSYTKPSGGESMEDRLQQRDIDCSTSRRKEHVIDEIDDFFIQNQSDSIASLRASLFGNMREFLATENQETDRGTIPFPSIDVPLFDSLDLKPEPVTSVDSKSSDTCTDEWIDDLFNTHSTEFLSTMAPKVLNRLVNNPTLDVTSQRQVRSRLLFEMESIYNQLKSSLNAAPLATDGDVTLALIRDIGERIIDEVKRQCAETL